MMYYFNIMLILSVLAGDLSNFFQFSRKHFFNDNEHSSTTEEGAEGERGHVSFVFPTMIRFYISNYLILIINDKLYKDADWFTHCVQQPCDPEPVTIGGEADVSAGVVLHLIESQLQQYEPLVGFKHKNHEPDTWNIILYWFRNAQQRFHRPWTSHLFADKDWWEKSRLDSTCLVSVSPV